MSSISVMIIVAVSGIAVALFFLNRPQFGPLAVVAACLVVPFDIGTGTGTRIGAGIILLGLLLALWLIQAVIQRSTRVYGSATDPPL